MRRGLAALLGVVSLAGLSLVSAPPAQAETCHTLYSNWQVYEGDVPFKVGDIATSHRVCVTGAGYTLRWASSSFAQTRTSAAAGLVYKMGPMEPVQTDATFDKWRAKGRYNFCIWKYGIEACGPTPWGRFRVVHRIGRYDGSVRIFVPNDYARGTNTWGQGFRVTR